ncbi:LuxR C-terminal-related transcriptional regulator [Candidatus Binatia bacterium]|nr:LuxR C-terminal-related transcriptional regulator [Candidatus Binatia bacterium]
MRHMTDDGAGGDGALGLAERVALTALLALIAVLVGADAFTDLAGGGSSGHVTTELIVAGTAAAGVGLLWARYARAQATLDATRDSLERARAEARDWRERNETSLRGLAEAIDRQLEAWRLSPAEREVAFLLLKGLSFKEIAAVRSASKRTVRQQALAVYAKSGLGGRAELSAFFLEDLLAPRA